jgi:hypothetical protein
MAMGKSRQARDSPVWQCGGRILVGLSDKGAGVALGPRLVLTAGHVAKSGQADASLVFKTWEGQEVPVIPPIRFAKGLDAAALKLAEDVTCSKVAKASEGERWLVNATGASNDPVLTGAITAIGLPITDAMGNRVTAMQLKVDQDLGGFKGYSGSAVLNEYGQVTGMLIEQKPLRIAVPRPAASNVLFALPIVDAAERLGIDVALAQPAPNPEDATGRATARNFFRHLIASHTALFAGREEQSAQIMDFVRQGGSGYIFVEGKSGYGKTSLLANLVEKHPEFCYHFISQIYRRSGSGFDPTRRSDVIRNLWEQLNTSPAWTADIRVLESEFQRFLFEPLTGPAVIVLDAIDELDPPDQLFGLFPNKLPEGLVIVLSARTQGDRSPLLDMGLSVPQMSLHLLLPGLDEQALTQLLDLAGGAAREVSRDRDFVTKLWEISRGDPFYIRFLVEDAANGLLTAESIDRAPSGLEAYLDLQLEMLQRSAHRPQHVEILGFLLEAGALSRDDLMHMVDGLSWLNFDVVMREIHRFLLVHDNQYTFCHDRFREYFQSKAH